MKDVTIKKITRTEEKNFEFIGNLMMLILFLGCIVIMATFIYYNNSFVDVKCLEPFGEEYCQLNNMTFKSSNSIFSESFYCIMDPDERLNPYGKRIEIFYTGEELNECLFKEKKSWRYLEK